VQPDLTGERPIATHVQGEFTGEMTMISGHRCLVLGRTTEPGEFLELTGEGLRSLIAKDAELSGIFMRAFILRRLELIRRGQGNFILMGSRGMKMAPSSSLRSMGGFTSPPLPHAGHGHPGNLCFELGCALSASILRTRVYPFAASVASSETHALIADR
jgi:hypothetical protein